MPFFALSSPYGLLLKTASTQNPPQEVEIRLSASGMLWQFLTLTLNCHASLCSGRMP